MHVWNVLQASRWKYRMQKIAKNSPSGHHRTTLSGCIFAAKARIDNQKTSIIVFYRTRGLSNALTETGICTSLKSDFYFRFHSPLNTKSALLNFICTWDLVLICLKMCSPEPENCWNRNLHTSKISKLLLVCLTNRHRCIHVPEPLTKFGENR